VLAALAIGGPYIYRWVRRPPLGGVE